jgi:hypothetical protein
MINFLIKPSLGFISSDTKTVYLNQGMVSRVPSSFCDASSLTVTPGLDQPNGYIYDCVRAAINFVNNNALGDPEKYLSAGQTFYNSTGVTRFEKLSPTITSDESKTTLITIMGLISEKFESDDNLLLKIKSLLTKYPLTIANVASPLDDLTVLELADRVYWFCASAMYLNSNYGGEFIDFPV